MIVTFEDYLSKKELVWLLFEVSFIYFSVRETSIESFLCFIIRGCVKSLPSSSFFINLDEWNLDDFRHISIKWTMNFLEKEIRKSRRKQSMEVAMQLWERKAWLNNFFLSPNYTIRVEPQLKYPINKYLLLLC